MIRIASAALAAAMLVSPAFAGEYNKKLTVGDAAPVWSDLEGVDGAKHGLADLKDKDVVVVCITCNHCPMAIAYEDRIISFTKKYAGPKDKVAFVAINVNNGEIDKLPKMKERASTKGFNFAYLYDPSQEIARAYGASVTPEFYVLNKERKVVYMGAMDDDRDPSSAKVNYLEKAVTATLKGEKPAKTETRARGCGVAYDK